MSSLFELLIDVFRFVSGIFSRRRERKEDLWAEIVEKRKAFSLALEDGRFSDAVMLAQELNVLFAQYGGKVRREARAARRSAARAAASLLAVAFLCSGCSSFGKSPQTVFVSGERVMILAPGDKLEVPDLMPPAKKWYLIDNVGLQYWFGIPAGTGSEEIRGNEK